MSEAEKIEEKKKVYSKKDLEKEILALAEKGLTPPKIGEELRKKGMHTKEVEIKISKILKEAGIYESPDVHYVKSKLGKIDKHLEKNKQDKRAIRERSRIFSALRKVKIYHKL